MSLIKPLSMSISVRMSIGLILRIPITISIFISILMSYKTQLSNGNSLADQCPYRIRCNNGGFQDVNHCHLCKCPPGYGGPYCDNAVRLQIPIASPSSARKSVRQYWIYSQTQLSPFHHRKITGLGSWLTLWKIGFGKRRIVYRKIF